MRVGVLLALLVAVVAVIAVRYFTGQRTSDQRLAVSTPALVPLSSAPAEAIAAESQVFRTRIDMLANADPKLARRAAHPRTLVTYRALRAYPGAPPRIPHGLSRTEYREGACKACHERGGFSVRFNAYVPVTPHPDFGGCMQCHVGDARLMGIPLPTSDPSSSCRQCHTQGGARSSVATQLWRTASWPSLQPTMAGRSPPPIPHDSPMRANCLACHAGPAAVAEIRTTHPQRANCRQCHVQASGTAEPVLSSGSEISAARGRAP